MNFLEIQKNIKQVIDKFKLSQYILIFLLLLMIPITALSYFLFWNKNDDSLIQNQNKQNIQNSNNVIHITLGKEFKLQKDQIAILEDNLLQIKILEFINHPCPEGARCIWSGLGIIFEYTNANGEKITGNNLTKAFGYTISVIDSDYDKYVKLRIEEDVEKEIAINKNSYLKILGFKYESSF